MQRRAHLDGDLVSLLDEVLLVGGLVALETLLELLDLLRHDRVLGDLDAIETFLLVGYVRRRVLVVHGR